MISSGRVRVNGAILETPAFLVSEGDAIEVDGNAIGKAEQTRLFLYHKPAGLVTTNRDEQGRKTIFDDLPGDMPRVVSVGRLDLNSEGLLLLTNDGGLARYLEHPENALERAYRVRVYGEINETRLKNLSKGAEIDGVRYGAVHVKIEQYGANSWLNVRLREGKNREIRKIMAALGLQVNKLVRTSYGPFALDDLRKSDVREIPSAQLHKTFGDVLK